MRPHRPLLSLLLSLSLLTAAACGDDASEETPANNGASNNAGNNGGDNNAGNNGGNNGGSGNRPPELGKIGSKRARVGESLAFEVTADDPDGDPLMFSVFGDLPEGAKFDKDTRRFSWTPTAEQVGVFAIVTFAVSDGELDDRETIQLEVVPAGGANSPPELADPGDQLLRIGEPFELQLQASDPDGDELSYRIDGPTPQGAELDKNSGLFSWTPMASDEGASFQLLFVVSDNQDEASVQVRLLVSELELSLGDVPLQEVRLGEELSLALPIDNPEQMPLTCTLLGESQGASVEGCTFRWTPSDVDLVGRTVEFAFKVEAESEGEPLALVGTIEVNVLPADDGGGNNGDNNTPACSPDGNEPNNDRGVATSVTNGALDANALTVCDGDEDWFAVDLSAGQVLTAEVTFTHADGDVDLDIYRGDEDVPTSRSTSVTDNESAVVTAEADDRYFVRVYGFRGSFNSYNLSIAVGDTTECSDDEAEPNNSAATAELVSGNHTATYFICPADADWFAVEVDSGQRLRAAILFDNSETDLDLALEGPGGELHSSEGIEGIEEIVVDPVPTGGVWTIRAYGFSPNDSVDYTLEVEAGESVGCQPDGLEPNDGADDALPLNPDDQLPGLSACEGDEDWFAYTLDAGSEMFATMEGAGVDQLSWVLLADDGSTVVAESAAADGGRELEVTASDTSRDFFMVVSGGSGQIYQLDVISLP